MTKSDRKLITRIHFLMAPDNPTAGNWRRLMDEIASTHSDDAQIGMYIEDTGEVELSIRYESLETDAEYVRRIEAAEKAKQRREAKKARKAAKAKEDAKLQERRERAELKRLRDKYGA